MVTNPKNSRFTKGKIISMGAIVLGSITIGFSNFTIETIAQETSYSSFNEVLAGFNSETVILMNSEQMNGYVRAYNIMIGDYDVTVASKEQAVQLLESLKDGYDINQDYYVSLVDGDRPNEYMVEIVQSLLSKAKNIADESLNQEAKVQAEEAEEAISPLTVTGTSPVKMVFLDEIQVKTQVTSADNIMSYEEAREAITQLKNVTETYVVQSGDTLQSVADSYKIEVSDIEAANTTLSEESELVTSQELVIHTTKPVASLQYIEQTSYRETYQKPPEYVYNDSKYIDEEEVIQEAVQGTILIDAQITYEDGFEVVRDIQDMHIITEATPLIINKGTLERPMYMFPITDPTISSTFGERWGRMHKGLDFACNEGTQVCAVRSGVVVNAGWIDGYGYCIYIDHGDGVSTRYAHLSEIQVETGQSVEQNGQIALSGNTGNSTGPHLHLEILINGTQVDPYPYLYE